MPMLMEMFKIVATEQLKLLLIVFLLGNSFRLLPVADPADACRRDLYLRLVATNYFLVITVLATATLLLAVLVAANTAATKEAIDSIVPVKRPSASLRGTLLVAISISVAASVLAVLAFEDGFLYRTGCVEDAGFGAVSDGGIVLTCLVGVVHGFSMWVAVSQD